MWKCTKCGSLSEGKFCGNCGSKRPETPVENNISNIPLNNLNINRPAENLQAKSVPPESIKPSADFDVNNPPTQCVRSDDDKTKVLSPDDIPTYFRQASDKTNQKPAEKPAEEMGNTYSQGYQNVNTPLGNIQGQNRQINNSNGVNFQMQNPGMINSNMPNGQINNRHMGNMQQNYGQMGYNGYNSGHRQNLAYVNNSNYNGNSHRNSMPKPPAKKSSNTSLWVMVAVLIAAVIIVAAIVVIALNNASNSTSVGEYKSSESTEVRKSKDKKVTVSKKDDDKDGEIEVNEISDSDIEDIINSNSSYTDFNIYVKNLTNDYEYGYRENKEVLASAMAQIVILDTVAELSENGEADVDFDEVYFSYIPNGKQAPNSPNQDGQYLTVRECIEDVAVYGDNNKSNHLIDYIAEKTNEDDGMEVINDRLRDMGYRSTRVNRKTFTNPDLVDTSVEPNSTCASEIGKIFENLVTGEALGSTRYMTGLFKSITDDGEALGLKAHIPSGYSSGNINAMTAQTTNNVAYITDGETDIVVVILSNTEEDKTNVENNEARDHVQGLLLDHILDTQFDD